MSEPPPTRKLVIVAKDPGLRLGGPEGPLAMTQVDVPAELLAKGPTGYRIKVVDYNSTEGRAYRDRQDYQLPTGELIDPFAPKANETIFDPAYQARLLSDPNFHAQNVYAIAMRTLGCFERALGRRVGWSSGGHQLNIAPHAFAQANAFYSEPDRALMFGYFRDAGNKPVFTSLSHDIVAHETTHAILDGLRSRFTEASGPDQAAFHEGFADIVALLSIFSLKQVVGWAIGEDSKFAVGKQEISLVKASKLTPDTIKDSILLGIAKQVGAQLNPDQRGALRRSVELKPDPALATSPDMAEEHDRGELLVAAVMNAFVNLWCVRIDELGKFNGDSYNLASVVEEGTSLARQLLNMCIRALDYCPTTDLDFGQYLAALLTADQEIVPDDSPYFYRKALRESFASYGFHTPDKGCDPATGTWERFARCSDLTYSRSNYDAMTRDKDEFFRFLWENRVALGISERGYTEVVSIDKSMRAGPDGIFLHETICQYVQIAEMFASECQAILGCPRPKDMKTTQRIKAFGGGVIVLDQYGQVKYHIANPLTGGLRQGERLQYLVDTDQLAAGGAPSAMRFALLHQKRMGS